MNYRNQVLTLILSFIIIIVSAQEEVIPGGGGQIPDAPGDTCFKLNLAEIFPATMDTVFGLEKLCINLLHPDPRELDMYLVAPDESAVEISTDNGNGEDMIATCFSMKSNLAVSAATLFNEVEVIPEENLGELNNGQMSVGLWQLCITDDTEGNTGELVSWELHLGNDPAPPEASVISPVCNTNTTVGCVCPDGGTNCFLLPDIIIAKRIMEEQYTEYAGRLTLTTATSNIGYGPLEFRGTGQWFCGDEQVEISSQYCPDNYEFPKQLVVQRIYRRFPDQTGGFIDQEAGFMQHHAQEGHDHPHIDNWAFNTLRIRGLNPDPTTWPIIGEGTKVSFCAENSIPCFNYNFFCEYDSVILDVTEMPNARMGNVYECNATVQGVSVGYSDIYGQTLEGQEIFFSPNTCNGKYYIVSEFDPDSIFQELNEENNVTFIEIELKEQSGNCCAVDFTAEQVEMNGSFMQFIDRSTPIPDKWIWEFGDGRASTEQFPVHEYEQPGTYTVTLSTENDLGCTSFKSIEVEVDSVIVSIQDNFIEQFQYESSIEPNPAKDVTIFTYEIRQSAAVQIEVIYVNGQLIQTIQPLIKQTKGKYQYPITNLNKGIYLIRTSLNGFEVFEKLVVL